MAYPTVTAEVPRYAARAAKCRQPGRCATDTAGAGIAAITANAEQRRTVATPAAAPADHAIATDTATATDTE